MPNWKPLSEYIKTYKKPVHEVQLAFAKLMFYFEQQELLNSSYFGYVSSFGYDEWPNREEAKKTRHPLNREYVQNVFCEEGSAINSNIKMCINNSSTKK